MTLSGFEDQQFVEEFGAETLALNEQLAVQFAYLQCVVSTIRDPQYTKNPFVEVERRKLFKLLVLGLDFVFV